MDTVSVHKSTPLTRSAVAAVEGLRRESGFKTSGFTKTLPSAKERVDGEGGVRVSKSGRSSYKYYSVVS